MDIQAFLVNTSIVEVGGVAPLGELSTHARTFSKNAQDYQLPISTGLSLTIFNDANPTPEQLVLVDKLVSAMLRETSQISVDNYQELALIRKITANLDITGLEIGDVVKYQNHKGVEYMKFEILRTSQANDTVMIYYSDSELRNRYSEVTYEVIPPTAIANLEQPYHDLLQVVPVNPVQAILATTGDTPHTDVHRIDVTIHALDDNTKTVVLPFYIVAWGNHSGVDYKVREALRSYILANTTEDAAWVAYFAPALWISNRFWMYPKWEDMAVDDGVDGMYSSVMNVPEHIAHMVAIGEYDNAYVSSHLELITVPYKNLMVGCIPSPANIAPNDKLTNIIPDYASDADNMMFSLQSETTKQWATMMYNLITVAEGRYTMDEVSTDILLSVHSAITYYTASTNGITYSVAAR